MAGRPSPLTVRLVRDRSRRRVGDIPRRPQQAEICLARSRTGRGVGRRGVANPNRTEKASQARIRQGRDWRALPISADEGFGGLQVGLLFPNVGFGEESDFAEFADLYLRTLSDSDFFDWGIHGLRGRKFLIWEVPTGTWSPPELAGETGAFSPARICRRGCRERASQAGWTGLLGAPKCLGRQPQLWLGGIVPLTAVPCTCGSHVCPLELSEPSGTRR